MPFAQLLAELGALCSAKRTGTMFIATSDNQSARIGLRQGRIVSLVFRTQRGLEAVGQIRKISAGRFSFSDAIVDRDSSTDLPDTPDLLAWLSGDAPPAPAAEPSTAATTTQPLANQQLAKAQAAIEAELTEFVGPIAPLLCREHIARAAAAGPPWDFPALVAAVAREIGDRSKEDRFKQQALARLRER
ncbi:MAG TPA: hypothetical protein VMT97_04410 [Terriglobales bacterium]|nr:hypothetical protein [Terriglobales bacterium]